MVMTRPVAVQFIAGECNGMFQLKHQDSHSTAFIEHFQTAAAVYQVFEK